MEFPAVLGVFLSNQRELRDFGALRCRVSCWVACASSEMLRTESLESLKSLNSLECVENGRIPL